jgi:hypothetical protein
MIEKYSRNEDDRKLQIKLKDMGFDAFDIINKANVKPEEQDSITDYVGENHDDDDVEL